MSRPRNALFAASLAAGLGCSGAAWAADDGYDNVFSSVLTAVGVLKPDAGPEIDYRERAPLVLPPKMTLAKPLAEGSARTAAWPQDPDVLRRRRAAEEARAPAARQLGTALDHVLSRDEMMQGRVAGATSADIPDIALRHSECGNQGNQKNCALLSPDQLSAMHESYVGTENAELVVGQEPERQYLTQPPKGYLKPSRVVKATVEAPKQRLDPSNPMTGLVDHPRTDDE